VVFVVWAERVQVELSDSLTVRVNRNGVVCDFVPISVEKSELDRTVDVVDSAVA